MKLHAREFEGAGGAPLIILHGMLGSSRNWATVGKKLAEFSHPVALDLPNHGDSPRADSASIQTMATAVLDWMDEHGVTRASLMGHSLGGKVAMRLACDVPERVERLFVLDIAPRPYSPNTATLDAMIAIDVGALQTRGDADAQLAAAGMGPTHRGFLLTNLVRNDSGGFRWQVPLEVIRNHIPEWTRTPLEAGDRYEGQTLFISGGRSEYLTRSDFEAARGSFPNSTLLVLPDSGHNVHIEGGDAFVDAVRTAMEAG